MIVIVLSFEAEGPLRIHDVELDINYNQVVGLDYQVKPLYH